MNPCTYHVRGHVPHSVDGDGEDEVVLAVWNCKWAWKVRQSDGLPYGCGHERTQRDEAGLVEGVGVPLRSGFRGEQLCLGHGAHARWFRLLWLLFILWRGGFRLQIQLRRRRQRARHALWRRVLFWLGWGLRLRFWSWIHRWFLSSRGWGFLTCGGWRQRCLLRHSLRSFFGGRWGWGFLGTQCVDGGNLGCNHVLPCGQGGGRHRSPSRFPMEGKCQDTVQETVESRRRLPRHELGADLHWRSPQPDHCFRQSRRDALWSIKLTPRAQEAIHSEFNNNFHVGELFLVRDTDGLERALELPPVKVRLKRACLLWGPLAPVRPVDVSGGGAAEQQSHFHRDNGLRRRTSFEGGAAAHNAVECLACHDLRGVASGVDDALGKRWGRRRHCYNLWLDLRHYRFRRFRLGRWSSHGLCLRTLEFCLEVLQFDFLHLQCNLRGHVGLLLLRWGVGWVAVGHVRIHWRLLRWLRRRRRFFLVQCCLEQSFELLNFFLLCFDLVAQQLLELLQLWVRRWGGCDPGVRRRLCLTRRHGTHCRRRPRHWREIRERHVARLQRWGLEVRRSKAEARAVVRRNVLRQNIRGGTCGVADADVQLRWNAHSLLHPSAAPVDLVHGEDGVHRRDEERQTEATRHKCTVSVDNLERCPRVQ
eukprot:PhM_4_TR9349/c0_g1_i1/m.17369